MRKPKTKVDDPELDPQESWRDYLCQIVDRWTFTSDKRQARSQRRELEIRKAALRVFARDGISKARIGDIAEEAGVSASTIYEYFESKEDLAYAVPVAYMARFFKEYAKAVESIETSQEKLSLYQWLAADYARRNPDWARLLYLEVWPSVLIQSSEVRHCLDDYVHIIIYLIREGAKAGEWPDHHDPYETAAILTGSLNQIITTKALYNRPRNLSKAAELLLLRTMKLLDPYELKPIYTSR